jgi:uncharacterized protein YecT (DUF1311 family)
MSSVALAQKSTERLAEPAELLPSGAILAKTAEEYAEQVNPCGRFASPSPAFQNCLQKAAAKVDRDLNEVYRQSVEVIPPSRKVALRDAQRAWLQFFNLNCGFVKAVAPAEAQMEQYCDCVIKMTTERAKELRYRIGD